MSEDSERTEVQPIPLSRRQKRDLVGLVAAGVMSAVFFVLPIAVVRDSLGAKPAPAPPPAAHPLPASIRVADLESVRVMTMDVAVPVSTPELQAPAPSVVRAVRWSGPPRSRRTAPPVAPRPSLGRRIARLLAGNGAHTVQPFPTIPATER